MNREEAIMLIGRYRPCDHENADTQLGNGKIWAKCEDCGATFQQDQWQDACNAAAKFDEAFDIFHTLDQLHEWASIKLAAYGDEIGVKGLTLEALINSHRNLVKELNATTRPEYRKTLEKARKQAAKAQLGQEWIRISKLRRMSLTKIAELIA